MLLIYFFLFSITVAATAKKVRIAQISRQREAAKTKPRAVEMETED